MKYLAALTAFALLASTAAFAQSSQSPSSSSSSTSSQQETSQGQTETVGPQVSKRFVRHIQRQLQREGLYHGDVNGEWDQASKESLEEFQQEHGLNATGELDAPTIMGLMRASPQQGMQPGTQQGGEQGMEGFGSSNPPGMPGGRAMMRAYERGYQQGFAQGFATAIQESQAQP